MNLRLMVILCAIVAKSSAASSHEGRIDSDVDIDDDLLLEYEDEEDFVEDELDIASTTTKINDFSETSSRDHSDEDLIASATSEDACSKHGCSHSCRKSSETGEPECNCAEGFELGDDEKTCEDVDECSEDLDEDEDYEYVQDEEADARSRLCSHECHNTIGSYECRCPEGMRLDSDNRTCLLAESTKDPCKSCTANQQCVDDTCACKEGFVLKNETCECPEGYYYDDPVCKDIDECSSDGVPCSHECINRIGSYECRCPEGMHIDVDYKTCLCPSNMTSINGSCLDPCESCKSNQQCVNSTCTCKDGFILKEESCECPEEYVYDDLFGICKVMEKCPEGMIYDIDDKTCLCVSNATSVNGSCVVDSSSSSTSTPPTSCQTGDEQCESCRNEGHKNCSHTCGTSAEGVFECRCPRGMVLGADDATCQCSQGFKTSSDGRGCVDVDECDSPNHGCHQVCVNSEDSYKCDCTSGFKLHLDGKNCVDVDECALLTHDCPFECTNTIGSYSCSPQLSPKVETRSSATKNVCFENNGNCSQVCKFDADSSRITCACFKGYALSPEDNTTCVDFDECSAPEVCSHTCVNFVGGYHCACPQGFDLAEDDRTCAPQPLSDGGCHRNNGGCSDICIGDELGGESRCACFDGYVLQGDEKACADFDECANSSTHDCAQICRNVEGSFACSCGAGYALGADAKSCELERRCDEGYRMMNDVCVDIDECETDDNQCDQICVNTDGGYQCECRDGFAVEEGLCTDIDECAEGDDACDQKCFNTEGGFECLCFEGFRKDGDRCVDVDECEDDDICDHECVNVDGGHECRCFDGFKMDSLKKCVDIDECEADGVCDQRCVNTNGGYRCECRVGYEADESGKCTDVDECENDVAVCEQKCVNVNGSYECRCFEGFRKDGDMCIDVDECEDDDICDHECVNTKGSYECGCFEGFKKDGDRCIDIDECEDEDVCDQKCVNTNGSYECHCFEGFIKDGDRCVDIDECLLRYPCDQKCVNTKGSYDCQCFEGFRKDGDRCVDIDECEDDVCDQKCVNTKGSYDCQCFKGFRKDEDRCVDIDECEDKNVCDQHCINTIGSHECRCFKGFKKDGDRCIDVDECQTRHTCDPSAVCVNSPGSFRCECASGFKLETAGGRSRCIAVEQSKACPHASAPRNGYMKCLSDARSASTRCRFWCDPGYKLAGSSLRTCARNGEWDGVEAKCRPRPCAPLARPERGRYAPVAACEGSASAVPPQQCSLVCDRGHAPAAGTARILTCVASAAGGEWSPRRRRHGRATCERIEPQIKPFIKCPPNIRVSLRPRERSVRVAIPRPVSNVDWNRYIDATPAWAKEPRVRALPPGVTEVIFKARSPHNDTVSSCQFTITVVDAEKPKVVFCPTSIDIVLGDGEAGRPIFWKEPRFSDNVRVAGVHKSKNPGSWIGRGIHHVDYIATDEAGNRAHCHFTVNVIDSNENAEDVHLRRGILMCPGQEPREFVPGYMNHIPKNCRLMWSKIRQKSAPLNYVKGPYRMRYYDNWNLYR